MEEVHLLQQEAPACSEAAEAGGGGGRAHGLDMQFARQAQGAGHVQRIADDDRPVQVVLEHQLTRLLQVLAGGARAGFDQDGFFGHLVAQGVAARYLRLGEARAVPIATGEQDPGGQPAPVQLDAVADAFLEYR